MLDTHEKSNEGKNIKHATDNLALLKKLSTATVVYEIIDFGLEKTANGRILNSLAS